MNRKQLLSIQTCTNLIATLVLCFHFINGVFGIAGISIVNIAFILLLELIVLKNRKFQLNIHIAFVCAFIILEFLISALRLVDISNTFSYLQYFLVFSVAAMIAGDMEIDIESVLKSILYVGLFGILILLMRGFSGMDSGTAMGISYSILPVFFSSVIIFLNSKKLRIYAIVSMILDLFVFVRIAPRGIWLNCIVFLFFIILLKIKNSKSAKNQRVIQICALAVALAVVWIVSNNLYEIVIWLDSFMYDKFKISVGALKKMIFYFNKGDLANGRNDLWSNAKAYISQAPFLGNGIGYFESHNYGAHPHNIILQALCEKGVIIGSILIIVVYGKAITLLFRIQDIDEDTSSYFSVIVITCGLVLLLYSSSYWLWVPFWYCLGFLISKRNKHSY